MPTIEGGVLALKPTAPMNTADRTACAIGSSWQIALFLLAMLVAWLPATGQAFWHAERSAEPDSIHVSQLPPEGRQTLALIKRGGPFPYAKDGTVFHNREGRLPARPRGYYREYTVITPGAPNRGARRIVAGRDGDYWYTADHYRTFKRIRE
jgi:ribonuclease T1